MFRKSDNPRPSGTTDALISYGTEVEGHMNCLSNLRIDGIFKGSIKSQGTVVIGESGEVHADIEAKQIVIAGKAFGELKTEGKLTITATGILFGNCESQWLVIQEGGMLNGSSTIERSSRNAEVLPCLNKDEDEDKQGIQNDTLSHKKKKGKEKQAG